MSIFSTIPVKRRKGSSFNLTHDVNTTVDIGSLVPVFCQEVIPGDIWSVRDHHLGRYSPLLAPVMHDIDERSETFFVPRRLLVGQDLNDRFFSGGEQGTDVIVEPLFAPGTQSSDFLSEFTTIGTLWDYMKLPMQQDPASGKYTAHGLFSAENPGDNISLLPFLAIQLIYQEYYRDQNLEPAAIKFPVTAQGLVTDENLIANALTLRRRAWEKDYFTGALPWLQRGPQSVIPLTGDANVYLQNDGNQLYKDSINSPSANGNAAFRGSSLHVLNTDDGGDLGVANLDPNGTLKADMSTVSAVSINDLRYASAVQRLLEGFARGGSRYIETILSQFGVKSSDVRMQRPELLSRSKQTSMISPIRQTSATQEGTTPLGELAGYGIVAGSSRGARRRFEEHGYLITLVSFRPRTAYMQGLHRMWTRRDRFEYAWPELATLGEQPVKTNELYKQPIYISPETNEAVDPIFGYVPRYSEYKYIPSATTGHFRSDRNYWNLTRLFSSTPTLSNDFVKIMPEDSNRIFAASGIVPEDKIQLSINFQVNVHRKLPKYGIPGLQ